MYYYYNEKVLHPGKFDDSDYNGGKAQKILRKSYPILKEYASYESVSVNI